MNFEGRFAVAVAWEDIIENDGMALECWVLVCESEGDSLGRVSKSRTHEIFIMQCGDVLESSSLC